MFVTRKTPGVSKRKFCKSAWFCAAAVIAAAAPCADASTDFTTWGGGTSATWATNANWSGNALPSTTVVAEFNSTFSNQPTLAAVATAEGVWATTGLGQDVTISGSTLTLTGNTDFGLTDHMAAGIVLDDTANHNLTISSAVTLSNSQSFWVDNTGTLTLGAISLGSKTLTLSGGNSSGKIILGGVISTAGSLVVNTSGAVTLSGTNSFTGGVTLTAGTLNLNNVKALGAAAAGPFVINGGTIDTTNGIGTLTSLASSTTIGGNFTYGGTGNLNLGVSPIVNAGDRIITLNGTSKTLTMGGVMTNSEGTLQTTTVNGAGNTFVIGGYALSNSATNYIDVINGSANVTISGAVTNGAGGSTASGLTYSGTGTLALNGANTFSGGTSIVAGTLSSSSGTTPFGGSTGAILLGNTAVGNSSIATLLYTGNSTTVANAITVEAGSSGLLTINSQTNTNTFTGTFAVNNAVTIAELTGTKTLGFTGQITGSSAITIGLGNLGTVSFFNNSGNPSTYSGNIILNAGIFSFGKAEIGTVTFGGGTLQWAQGLNTMDVSSGLAATGSSTVNLDVDDNAVVFANAIGSGVTGGLTLTSSTAGGSLTLTGANLYTGLTTVTSGTLQLAGAGGTIAGGNALTTASGGTFDLNGNSQTLGTLTHAGAIINSGSGTPTLTLGDGSSGAGSFAGAMNIIWNQANTNSSLTGSINNQGTITNSGTGTGTATISGVIGTSVTGLSENSSTSNLVLSGANTFSGGAALKLGTLQLGIAEVITSGVLISGPVGLGTFHIGSGTNAVNLQTNVTNATVRTLSNNISLDGDITFSTTAATGRIALDGVGIATGNNSLSSPDTITLTRTNSLTVNSAVTLDLGGNITGNFGLTILGSGTVNIGSTQGTTEAIANTYTGLTTVSGGNVTLNKTTTTDAIPGNLQIDTAGTVTLNFSENIDNSSAVTINTGGTLAMGSKTETIGSLSLGGGSITGSGTLTINSSGTATLTGGSIAPALVLGTGGLSITPSGSATATVSGGVTSTGSANITITNAGSGAVTLGSVNNQGTLTNNGGGANTTTLGAAIGTNVTGITENSSTSALTLNGPITSGAGLLSITDTAGSLNLSGALTVGSGGVKFTNTSGTFTVNSGSALAFSGAGTLDLNGVSASFAGLTGAGTLTDSGAAATLTSTATGIFTGTLTDAGSGNALALSVTGGTLTMGNATYHGVTTIGSGSTITIAASLGAVDPLGSNSELDLAGTLGANSGSTFISSKNIYLGTSAGGSGGTFTTTATLSGIVSDAHSPAVGGDSLTLSGNGKVLILSNAGNTYSGGTIVIGTGTTVGTAAIVVVTADSQLGAVPASPAAGANNITLRGISSGVGAMIRTELTMTLNANRGIALGSSGAGATASTGGILEADNGLTLTYNGIIKDEIPGAAGTLQINDITSGQQGTVLLGNAASTYSGGTQIIGGTGSQLLISTGDSGGFGPLGAVPGTPSANNIQFVQGKANFGVDASAAADVSLDANRGILLKMNDSTHTATQLSNLINNSSHNFIINGTITADGTLNAAGANEDTLGFTGVGNITLMTAPSLNVNLTDANTATVNFNAGATLSGTVANTGTGALVFTAASTFNGNVSTASGTIALGSATNTFNNTNPTFTVTGSGSLKIAADGSLGATPTSATQDIFLDSSTTAGLGTLEFTANTTLNAFRTVVIGGSGTSSNYGGGFNVDGGVTVHYDGLITNGGSQGASFTKSGAGALYYGGSAAFTNKDTQGTVIAAGTLALEGSGSLPAGSLLTLTGGTFDLNGLNASPARLIGSSGTIITNNNNAATSTFSLVGVGGLRGTADTFAGVFQDGAGVLAVNFDIAHGGTAEVPNETLTGNSTYSGGTTLTSGVVKLGVNNALPTTGNVIASGGSLNLNALTQTIGALSGANAASAIFNGTGATTASLIVTGTGTYNGTLGTGGTNMALTLNGTGQVLTLNSTNTYTGGTTIMGGTLKLGSAASLASTSIIVGDTVADSAAIFDVSAVTGGFHVVTGQTLAGHGTVVGAVTADSGSHLSPGNTIGTTTYATGSALTLSGGSNLDYEFATPLTGHTFVSGSSDLTAIATGATATFTGTVNLNLIAGAANFTGSGSYELLSYVDSGSVFGFTPGDGVTGGSILLGTGWSSVTGETFTISNYPANNGIFLDFAPASVPEPASLALLGLGAIGLLARRKSKTR